MATILQEKKAFEEKLVVEEGQIESHGQKFTRQRINREDAVAILLVNTSSNKVILTRQFRYAIAAKTEEHILEIVAGKVDKDEEPRQTAIREVEEETGYKVKNQNLEILLSCFVSPGYTSEQFIIYFGKVDDNDKISKGGGLEEENEHIELVEMPIPEFVENIKGGHFKDAKTFIAGMHLLLHKMLG